MVDQLGATVVHAVAIKGTRQSSPVRCAFNVRAPTSREADADADPAAATTLEKVVKEPPKATSSCLIRVGQNTGGASNGGASRPQPEEKVPPDLPRAVSIEAGPGVLAVLRREVEKAGTTGRRIVDKLELTAAASDDTAIRKNSSTTEAAVPPPMPPSSPAPSKASARYVSDGSRAAAANAAAATREEAARRRTWAALESSERYGELEFQKTEARLGHFDWRRFLVDLDW